MKATAKLLSSLSVATIAMSAAAPAFAYIAPAGFAPVREARTANNIPNFGPFNKDAGSGFLSERPVDATSTVKFDEDDSRQLTSRRIARKAKLENDLRTATASSEMIPYGEGRDSSETGYSGRFHLPYRSQAVRFQRNENRHYLGQRRPDGQYRRTLRLRAAQGDQRIRPVGVSNSLYTFPERLLKNIESSEDDALLPPALVQTGVAETHPNQTRAARGHENDVNARNINYFNRR